MQFDIQYDQAIGNQIMNGIKSLLSNVMLTIIVKFEILTSAIKSSRKTIVIFKFDI